MRARRLLAPLALLLAATVFQTTLFSRFDFVTPDLVLLLVILMATTDLRREAVLAFGFAGGLLVDLLSSNVVGLRAAVFTTVAYLAIRTVNRVDLGPVAVALWVAALTLVGVVFFLILGTLFGQGGLIATGLGRRVIFVPITNLALSFLVAPLVQRVTGSNTRGLL